ncbi:MAG: hypothetical protein ABIA12_01345 [Candidatus Aenigmatarchaeota archaeon]
MLDKVAGVVLLVVGFFMFALGPYDRVQIEAFSRLARLVGLIMMIAGVVLLKG